MNYKNLSTLIRLFILLAIIYIAAVCTIGRFSCPAATETQLFTRIPNFIVGDFSCPENIYKNGVGETMYFDSGTYKVSGTVPNLKIEKQ